MEYDDVLTRNENQELAVRVVSGTEQATIINPNDVYTRTTDGYLAVRTVGGSGGGSVDYNRVVEKTTIIPSVENQPIGKVYMYMGESNSTYTHGYIYEVVATQTASAVAFSGNIISSWNIEDFTSYLQEGGSAYNEITHGTLTYTADGNLWVLVGYDSNNIEVMKFQEYTEDLEDFGCVFVSQTHQEGENCTFTMTTKESGKKWKRLDVQPASEGGGVSPDPHNLGWYATQSALETAHPTAEDGDWAIVGVTDTVWVWDSDTNAWKDTDQKGQVESVNSKTGTVVLTPSDIGAATAAQGAKADTAIQSVKTINGQTITGEGNVSLTAADVDAIPQVANLPTASASYENAIIQSRSDGYFYKCVSDGQDPATYSWERIDVQPASEVLPDQTGQSGKFLTTDGTDASWSDKPLVNNSTNNTSISIKGSTGSFSDSVFVGVYSGGLACNYSTYIGYNASPTGGSGHYNTCVGYDAKTNSNIGGCIQLGRGINSENGTFCVGLSDQFGNNQHNYKMLDNDGTIPADRLVHAINKYSTMPTAASTNEGWIIQYTGATDSTYTHGHLYECVSDGADPATYSWEEVSMGGGGSSYTAGTGIDITNDVISITNPVLQNKALGAESFSTNDLSANKRNCTILGIYAGAGGSALSVNGATGYGQNSITGNYSVAIGQSAQAGLPSSTLSARNIAIGYAAKAGTTTNVENAIQLGAPVSGATNNDSNTLKVANANGNFELLSANGTIPAARHSSLPATDGTYVLKLIISDSVPTLSWVAE